MSPNQPTDHDDWLMDLQSPDDLFRCPMCEEGLIHTPQGWAECPHCEGSGEIERRVAEKLHREREQE